MNNPKNTPTPGQKKQNQAFASDGTSFDPRSDIWNFRTLSGAVTLDFGLLRESSTSTFVLDAKAAMKVLVETRNLQSVRAAYLQFRKLIIVAHMRQDMLIDQIDPEDIASWCGSGNAAYIGQLRPIFEIWKTLQLKGVEQETFEFIHEIRTFASVDKEGVRTWNPDTGAYRPAEDAVLKTALDAGFNVRLRRRPSDFGYDPMISPTLCLISFTALKSKFSLLPMVFAVGNGRMRTNSGLSRKALSATGK